MRTSAAALGFVLALTACADEPSAARRLPDARLPTRAGTRGDSLASCPTEKCLTVLVAPWCGVCRSEAANIVQLRRFLDRAGVSSRIVVGLSGDLRELESFASEFGADALLDAEGAVSARSVPLFIVNDRQGRVLKSLAGFPRGARGPEDVARVLDLP